MEKIDYKKIYNELYQPSAKNPALIEVPAMNFLMVDGQGDPQSLSCLPGSDPYALCLGLHDQIPAEEITQQSGICRPATGRSLVDQQLYSGFLRQVSLALDFDDHATGHRYAGGFSARIEGGETQKGLSA